MFHYSIILVIIYLLYATCGVYTNINDDNKEWDYLIFTQHWPVTVCQVWQEKKPNNNCTLPPNDNYWTVHGIWPTRIGKEGPFFCNKSWNFDESQIKPFEDSLEKYWMNIEANTKLTSLWKHEWTKHGTCAAQLPELNSEANYFGKGIEWVKKYNLAEILTSNQIVPTGKSYSVQDIHNAVVGSLGKNPMIQCVVHKKNKESLLSEIRICLDKQFEVVDCNVLADSYPYSRNGILTNCNTEKPVMYYGKVSVSGMDYEDYELFIHEGCLVLLTNIRDNIYWENLVFSQHWPTTACGKLQNKWKCIFYDSPQHWTANGIWVSRRGTDGPTYCNNTWTLDPELTKPFDYDLHKYWSIVGSNTSLYKNEWLKHGTCVAEVMPYFDEQIYFRKAIEWVRKYDLIKFLANKYIYAGPRSYNITDIFHALYAALGKNPVILCVVHERVNEYLLSEVRLCFDRLLKLVDCDPETYIDYKYSFDKYGILTNCDINKPIMYYNGLPSSKYYTPEYKSSDLPDDFVIENGKIYKTDEWLAVKLNYMNKLKSIFDILTFLIWFTR